MANSPTILRTTRGFQRTLFAASPIESSKATEPKGVVYTRQWVVELLLDLAGYRSHQNLVDATAIEPAAGNGAFLGLMIQRLIASCRQQERPLIDCAGSLLAYELDVASAGGARSLAVTTLVNLDVDRHTAETLAESWVSAADYLLEANSREADFVVGNPPYVRLEDIPEGTAAHYRDLYSTMRGRADLYIAFFEAALSQLKSNGVCAFICADRWMRNQYGAELRQLVTSAFSVDIVLEMHKANAFHDEVDAYTAITIIRRARQGPTVVASAGSDVHLTEAPVLAAALQATSARPPSARQGTAPKDSYPGLSSTLIDKWFTGPAPWPCHSPGQLALLRKLEEQFDPLESTAKVGIGVATGNDMVFITKDPKLVEPSRLLKLALAQDIASGKLEWSGHYLVDPWNTQGLVELTKYPRLKAYFEQHAVALKKRHTAANNKLGWYKTIDRVTHTLSSKPKLLIADIKNTLHPVLDSGETYPHHNLYFVESEEWDLEVLGGLLLSALGQFFVQSYGIRMRGGYWRFQAQYLRRIRLPSPHVISRDHAKELKKSFVLRDGRRATVAALEVYGITQTEWERAIEY